jgi:hypothetical protein
LRSVQTYGSQLNVFSSDIIISMSEWFIFDRGLS